MLIGKLSLLSGFSKDTIRYYEKIGLIVAVTRKGSAYKHYPDELLHVLGAIRKYKELGFTLEEIRELLVRQQMGVLDVAKMLQVVEVKLKGMDAEIERLHHARLRLGREHQQLMLKKTGRILTLPEMRMAA